MSPPPDFELYAQILFPHRHAGEKGASPLELKVEDGSNTWVWILLVAGAVIVLGGGFVFRKKFFENK